MKNQKDISKLCYAEHQVITDTRNEHMNILTVTNGSTLSFDILLDRGMDIGRCFFNSENIVYISNNGYVSTTNYVETPNSFMNYFIGGLLTTCGLRNVGPSCAVNDHFYGQHGRISNTRTKDYSVDGVWINKKYHLSITGNIYETDTLFLTRTITTVYGSNKINIKDIITNKSLIKEKIMFMYHFNFSRPLISIDTQLKIPSLKVIARDDDATKGVHEYNKFQPAATEYPEQVFFHEGFESDYTNISINNQRENISVHITYNQSQLPKLTQWKVMSTSNYVLGIEPGLSRPIGRDVALHTNEITMLHPNEKIYSEVEIEFNKSKMF